MKCNYLIFISYCISSKARISANAKYCTSAHKSRLIVSKINHLHASCNWLPIFSAEGHYNYLKSAYLYLQEMGEIESNPKVYRMFQIGLHAVLRTNQFCAGLGCDLVIEQTLMRSLITSGRLTYGNNMTEDQRACVQCQLLLCLSTISLCNTWMNSHTHKRTSQRFLYLNNWKRDFGHLKNYRKNYHHVRIFFSDSSFRNIINGILAIEDVFGKKEK